MASSSDLAHLYQLVFGVPPSTMSMAALQRMEAFLGLAQDDPLARMLIVQLRVADQIAENYAQRSQQEKAHRDELRGLTTELHGLTARVSEARFGVGRRARAAAGGDHPASVAVDTYRRASPLVSYLAAAFRRCDGVADSDERIGAARLDLAYMTGVAAVMLLCGMGFGRMVW